MSAFNKRVIQNNEPYTKNLKTKILMKAIFSNQWLRVIDMLCGEVIAFDLHLLGSTFMFNKLFLWDRFINMAD